MTIHKQIPSWLRIGPGAGAPTAVVVAVLLGWWRTVYFGWTGWDDGVFVADNPVLRASTGTALRHILIPGQIPNEVLWIPMTYLSHLAEANLHGLAAGGLHVVNVMLHATNALLVYLVAMALLERFGYVRKYGAALAAAALFAFHPLQAETVAWIMGRKDLLSTCGVLAGTLIILRGRSPYLACLCYALAMLSKPTALLVPIFWWLLPGGGQGRFAGRPLLVCAGVALGCWWLNRAGGGGVELFRGWYLAEIGVGWLRRAFLLEPPRAVYASGTFFVADNIRLSSWAAMFFLGGCGYYLIRAKCWLTCWSLSALLLTAAPAAQIALAPVRDFYTADRYGYLPVAFAAMALLPVWLALTALVSRWQMAVPAGLAGGLLVFCWPVQSGWKDHDTLWRRVLALDPDSYVAENALAGPTDAGPRLYRAVAIYPQYAAAWSNLGVISFAAGRYGRAENQFSMALGLHASNPECWYSRSTARLRQGDLDGALADADKAVAIFAGNPAYHQQRGIVLAEMGRGMDAYRAYVDATLIDPLPVYTYAAALAAMDAGLGPQAIQALNLTLRAEPSHYRARANLAMLISSESPDQARAELARAAADAQASGDVGTCGRILKMAASLDSTQK